jgi:hypothetical protein
MSINSGVLPNIYAVFNSTSPYSFYSYPITSFKVSEYQFCLIDSDTGIDPNHADFVLINTYSGCMEPGNYSIFDNMTESQFYAINPSLTNLTTNKGFPVPGNW